MSNVLDTFLELVQISSPSENEHPVREWLIAWAEKNQWTHATDTVGNIVITKNAKIMLPFFLCAHMDTVQPGENIRPQISGDIITSDGSTILGADNKASLAAILTAIEVWQEHSSSGFQLLFTVREEIGGGVEHFNASLLTTKTGYVFDYAKPLGTFVEAAPYITNFTATFSGKSAHACFPELGENALTAANAFLNTIKLGKQSDHKSYINIGLVSGGSSINAIPGKMVLHGEVRSFDQTRFHYHIEHLKEQILSCKKDDLAVTFETHGFCPGYSHNTNESAYKHLAACFKRAGILAHSESAFGVSDANSLNAMGFTVVTASDGVVNPHTTQESIAASDLKRLTEVILLLLES